MTYNYYLQWNNGFLFVSEDNVCSFLDVDNSQSHTLVLDTFQNRKVYRLPNTTKRISKGTIKRKRKKCNVIL